VLAAASADGAVLIYDLGLSTAQPALLVSAWGGCVLWGVAALSLSSRTLVYKAFCFPFFSRSLYFSICLLLHFFLKVRAPEASSSSSSSGGGGSSAVHALAFNPKMRAFLAFGDARGEVHVWRVPLVADAQAGEQQALDRLVRSLADHDEEGGGEGEGADASSSGAGREEAAKVSPL
jgi:hypothetical protein